MKLPDFGMKNDLGIVRRFLALTHKIDGRFIPLVAIGSVIKAVTPFINVIMPKFIIDELMGQQRVDVFIQLVTITIIGNALFNLLNRYFETKTDIANRSLSYGFDRHLGLHIMNMDFESLEDPDVLDHKERALFPIMNQGVILRTLQSVAGISQAFITIIGLAAIVSMLNPLLILVILAVVAVNAFIFAKSLKAQYQFFEMLTPLNKHFNYYASLTSDFTIAKDVRLYGMSPFILAKLDKYRKVNMTAFETLYKKEGGYQAVSAINLQVQMLIVYAYMVWQVFLGALTIGDFTMYITAANQFSTNVSTFITQFMTFRQMCRYLEEYLSFEEMPRRAVTGERAVPKMENATIEFRNVWFKYPRADEYTLKDVSLTIRAGERLSVVGQNGAGKTTFIKLLCRLYHPDKGDILINGVNINEYDFESYMKALAVVFQDYKLFSFTVRENIAFGDLGRDREVEDALLKSGVSDTIATLPKGISTPLYKNFEKDGIEISGGDMQKLAIARAIYRDAPVVVLDEPTAALDPYAEFEVYSKFDELVQGKTTIYISHRLSSCRFSDHIAVFDHGQLIEYGNHATLVAAGGKYAEMWEAQKEYYV